MLGRIEGYGDSMTNLGFPGPPIRFIRYYQRTPTVNDYIAVRKDLKREFGRPRKIQSRQGGPNLEGDIEEGVSDVVVVLF